MVRKSRKTGKTHKKLEKPEENRLTNVCEGRKVDIGTVHRTRMNIGKSHPSVCGPVRTVSPEVFFYAKE
ncbi:MAG: hypothetical protein JSS87_09985 [Acidobacteria bacterium]|nr:hypothetical protein [Acidobacteriota bacterium]